MKKTLSLSDGNSDIIIDLKDVKCIHRDDERIWILFYEQIQGYIQITCLGKDGIEVAKYICKVMSEYFREENQGDGRYVYYQNIVSKETYPFEIAYLYRKEK